MNSHRNLQQQNGGCDTTNDFGDQREDQRNKSGAGDDAFGIHQRIHQRQVQQRQQFVERHQQKHQQPTTSFSIGACRLEEFISNGQQEGRGGGPEIETNESSSNLWVEEEDDMQEQSTGQQQNSATDGGPSMEEQEEQQKKQQEQAELRRKYYYENTVIFWRGNRKGERPLAFQLPQGSQQLAAAKVIRERPAHGYTTENAKRALQCFEKRGLLVQNSLRVICVHAYGGLYEFSAQVAISGIFRAILNISVPSQDLREIKFEAQNRGRDRTEGECIVQALAWLYRKDVIKEAAAEIFCPRRKYLLRPELKLKAGLRCWFDAPNDEFLERMDKIGANPANFAGPNRVRESLLVDIRDHGEGTSSQQQKPQKVLPSVPIMPLIVQQAKYMKKQQQNVPMPAIKEQETIVSNNTNNAAVPGSSAFSNNNINLNLEFQSPQQQQQLLIDIGPVEEEEKVPPVFEVEPSVPLIPAANKVEQKTAIPVVQQQQNGGNLAAGTLMMMNNNGNDDSGKKKTVKSSPLESMMEKELETFSEIGHWQPFLTSWEQRSGTGSSSTAKTSTTMEAPNEQQNQLDDDIAGKEEEEEHSPIIRF